MARQCAAKQLATHGATRTTSLQLDHTPSLHHHHRHPHRQPTHYSDSQCRLASSTWPTRRHLRCQTTQRRFSAAASRSATLTSHLRAALNFSALSSAQSDRSCCPLDQTPRPPHLFHRLHRDLPNRTVHHRRQSKPPRLAQYLMNQRTLLWT